MNKYIHTYHRTTKMKPVDVNPAMHIDFNKANKKEGSTFKVGDHVRTSKYIYMFLQKAAFQFDLERFW